MNNELIEPFAAPEFFVDGFTDFEVTNGLLTCTAFRLQRGLPVILFRVVICAGAALSSIDQAVAALNEAKFAKSNLVEIKRGAH